MRCVMSPAATGIMTDSCGTFPFRDKWLCEGRFAETATRRFPPVKWLKESLHDMGA